MMFWLYFFIWFEQHAQAPFLFCLLFCDICKSEFLAINNPILANPSGFILLSIPQWAVPLYKATGSIWKVLTLANPVLSKIKSFSWWWRMPLAPRYHRCDCGILQMRGQQWHHTNLKSFSFCSWSLVIIIHKRTRIKDMTQLLSGTLSESVRLYF